MVHELSREHGFRRARQGMQPVVVEQRELVVVGADRVLREVRGEQRQFFPAAFFLRVFVQLLAFGREPDAWDVEALDGSLQRYETMCTLMRKDLA